MQQEKLLLHQVPDMGCHLKVVCMLDIPRLAALWPHLAEHDWIGGKNTWLRPKTNGNLYSSQMCVCVCVNQCFFFYRVILGVYWHGKSLGWSHYPYNISEKAFGSHESACRNSWFGWQEGQWGVGYLHAFLGSTVIPQRCRDDILNPYKHPCVLQQGTHSFCTMITLRLIMRD